MKRYLGAAGAFLAIALSMGSCEKQAPTADPAWAYQVSGDSVTFQAFYYGGDRHGANDTDLVGIGWEAEHAQAQLNENVYTKGHSPGRFVMAFGQNYADAYTEADRNEVMALMFTPCSAADQCGGVRACVVVVLPYRAGPGDPEIAAYRKHVMELATARRNGGSPTVVVDWAPIAKAHPEYLHPDGVHLSSRDADGDGRWDAAVAFADLIWSGAEQCP